MPPWTTATEARMAKPDKKGPVQTVRISCLQCKVMLFKYRKGGKGTGSLGATLNGRDGTFTG
jgi:hypothetical protein